LRALRRVELRRAVRPRGFTVTTTSPRKLISQLLAEDAELRDVVEDFVRVLPDRLAELRRAFEDLDWNQLTTFAHRLKGASGSYGYPEISEVAARMESAFRAQEAGNFGEWSQELDLLIRAAELGLAEH